MEEHIGWEEILNSSYGEQAKKRWERFFEKVDPSRHHVKILTGQLEEG